MTIELQDHIGLCRTNSLKRHPLCGVSRLCEERCAAAQLDQLWRQVPAHQDGTRWTSDAPVRVSIILYADAILQEAGVIPGSNAKDAKTAGCFRKRQGKAHTLIYGRGSSAWCVARSVFPRQSACTIS